jgi:chromosome segregation ATPase
MNRNLTTLLLGLLVLPLATAAIGADGKSSARIKKCQDPSGNWHYGDTADEECTHSQVIELDTQGIQRKVTAAPLTAEQLKAREQNRANEDRLRKLSDDQKRRDEQLLATYAVEADIILMRDRKNEDLEKQIHASQETLDSLRKSLARIKAQAAEEQRTGKAVTPQTAKTIANNEAQVSRHEAAIQSTKHEQELMRKQFQADLERFRELKSGVAKTSPEAPSAAAPAPGAGPKP